MKRVFLAIMLLTFSVVTFTSCKGEKKTEKKVETEVKETVPPVKAVETATTISAE